MRTSENVDHSNDTENTISRKKLIAIFMNYVLENGALPASIYKFSKENEFEEADFYTHFGSFDMLQIEIWNEFFHQTHTLLNKNEDYVACSPREKILLFYYTFFELLEANRSYVLCTFGKNRESLSNLRQLKGLRKNVKEFAKNLIEERNETEKSAKQNTMIFSEALWVQTLFLLRFWLKDNSPKFEKTDMAIEKSVNTAFDIFDFAPLERMVDFGKFLWKEKAL